MASSVPSVYPFRFAWVRVSRSLHHYRLQKIQLSNPVDSVAPNGGDSFTPKISAGIFVKLRSRTQLQTKPRSVVGVFFFNARTVALKRKIWVKNLWDSEDLRLWERFGGCNESRGFWNRIKNIEVQNLDSFEACSVHFYGAICHIQVATSVARARPEPPVIPKSKSWETNWNEDFWYPVEPWESPKYTGYCFCVIN